MFHKIPLGYMNVLVHKVTLGFNDHMVHIHFISHHSKQTYKKVWKDSDRDYWMTAQEALDYGMIDEVLVKNKK